MASTSTSTLVGFFRDLMSDLSRTAFSQQKRRRRSSLSRFGELAEPRILLSTHSLAPVADGVVADRDLDGQFEFADSSSSSVTNRWFDFGGIGQERAVFEFDLSQFAPGSVVTSARLGAHVTSFTSGATSGPVLSFSLKAGDGSVTPVDGDGSGVAAGNASVSATGYREFTLTASTLSAFVGGRVAVRLSNSALNGHWISAASSEDAVFSAPALIIEVANPSLAISVNPNVLKEDGSVTAVGTVTRTGDMSQSWTVNLSVNDTTEVAVPSTVTIPAGQSTAQFAVTALDDNDVDGAQQVTITARATIAAGTPFGVDTTFGTNGSAPTRALTAIQPSRAVVSPLSDGKYLIASEVSGGTSWQLLRYNSNGTLDSTFGSNGVSTTSFSSSQTYPVPFRIVVQPDGKILVGGKFSSGFGSAVLARYNANGTLDTTFGIAGRADLANLGGWIEDIALRPDGRILLGVAFNGTIYFRVAGLTSTGQFDGSFGIKTYTSINASVKAIELLDDGSFILAGGKFVAKFTSAGVLDTTYGTNGITNVGLTAPEYAEVFDAKIGSNGTLSLGMYRYSNVTQNTNNTMNMAAMRLTSSGAIDTTFNNGSLRAVDFNGLDDFPSSMVLQSDGKIILGGYTEVVDNNRDMAMVRFNTDGSLDTTFDGDGRFQQNVISYTGEMVSSIAQQADGKLISLAGFGNDYRLFRYFTGTESVAPQASVSVTVQDDENAPPVVQSRTFQIPENLPTGNLVGHVIASDPDAGQTLTYSITNSSLPGAFTIDATSGALSVADGTLLNYEAITAVTLTITATDNGVPNRSGSNSVLINLNNVNERPLVSSLQLFDVDENVVNGTVVGTFVATDPDAGQTLTWQITDESLPGAFALNGTTGQITVADRTQLNFEVLQSASLTVRVSDNHSAPLSSSGTAGISIRDINEAPIVYSPAYSVVENSGSGTSVGHVLAADPDYGQQFTYAITGQSVPGAFAVDTVSGEIVVANPALIDFDVTPQITIDMQVTDNGTPALSTTRTLTVSLQNVNESPTILSQSFSIAENSAAGTVVGTSTATDPDAGQTLSYSIAGASLPGAFMIDASTGQIKVADSSLLNHEQTSSVQLTISVSDDATPQLTSSAVVTVNITDRNEAPSVSDASFSIREYLNGGLTVGYVIASDPDAGQTLRYSIVDQSVPEAFMIRMYTGEIIVWRSAVLDYETVSQITVTVRVTDSANPALSATATVNVSINDVNESPVMDSQFFSVAENAANGTVLGAINGSDVDFGQTLTWTISSTPVPGAFAVNPATGVLSVADGSLLNYESRASIQLSMLLSDNGTPVLATFAPVTISITDVNEAPTVPDRTYTIDENSAVSTSVGSAAGSDPDAGQALSYALSGSTLPGAFAVDVVTGHVTVANQSLLDYESITSVSLQITATDSANPGLSGSGTVTVNLRDLNEAPLVTNQTFSINENAPNGAIVGTLIASEPDRGQQLSYSITSSSHPGAFVIDSTTGRITVGNSQLLNRESTASIVLNTSVRDNGTPSLVSTATVVILLNDVNETPVVGNQLLFIDENLPNGTVIGTADGSDVDAGQSLTYSIVGSTRPGAFTINASTGQISVAETALLDFESGTRINLTVAAADNGTPSLAATGVVTVELRNVNDAPSLANFTFSIDENSPTGTLLGQVSGTDADTGQSLSYSISAASVSGVFAINPTTGQITVASNAQLNFESVTQIVLTVTATDNGVPSLSDSGVVTINVRNVNETPSVNAQTFTVNENSVAGTVIGQVVASDVDAGQALTYSLISGNTSGAFAINAASGQLTVANASVLDFETTPSFLVTVRVADNGSPTLYRDAVLTIRLNDVVEATAVGIDVVPGDSTNTFRRTAKFEIAILSTATFDARNVAVNSVRFGKLGTEDSVVQDRRGNRIFSYRDVNGDGRLDLVLQIDGANTGLQVGDTLGRLTAKLQSGLDLFGSSSIIVKK